MRNIPGTIPESLPQIIPRPHTSYEGKDMDHDRQLHADTSVEQLHPTPAAQNTIYAKTQSQTDIDSIKQPSTERTRTLSGNPRNVLWN